MSFTSPKHQLFLPFSLNEFQMSAIFSMGGYVFFFVFFFVRTFFDKNAEAKINQNSSRRKLMKNVFVLVICILNECIKKR